MLEQATGWAAKLLEFAHGHGWAKTLTGGEQGLWVTIEFTFAIERCCCWRSTSPLERHHDQPECVTAAGQPAGGTSMLTLAFGVIWCAAAEAALPPPPPFSADCRGLPPRFPAPPHLPTHLPPSLCTDLQIFRQWEHHAGSAVLLLLLLLLSHPALCLLISAVLGRVLVRVNYLVLAVVACQTVSTPWRPARPGLPSGRRACSSATPSVPCSSRCPACATGRLASSAPNAAIAAPEQWAHVQACAGGKGRRGAACCVVPKPGDFAVSVCTCAVVGNDGVRWSRSKHISIVCALCHGVAVRVAMGSPAQFMWGIAVVACPPRSIPLLLRHSCSSPVIFPNSDLGRAGTTPAGQCMAVMTWMMLAVGVLAPLCILTPLELRDRRRALAAAARQLPPAEFQRQQQEHACQVALLLQPSMRNVYLASCLLWAAAAAFGVASL